MDARTETAYDAAIDYARKLGAEHGRNAAGWWLQDELSPAVRPISRPVGRARRILAGIEDGDPAILDTFPAPDLSGEWADTLTGPELFEGALRAAGDDTLRAGMTVYGDVCDAYESAFSDAVTDAIETAARAVLA